MRTIIHFFEESVNKYGSNVYMWEKTGNSYEGTTYKEMHELVSRFAAGLIQLGVKKGDRIGLISEGRKSWVVCELGILYAGAVNVPLSVKLGDAQEISFRLKHSGSKMVIASKQQERKLKGLKDKLKELEKIILLDEKEEEVEAFEITYHEILSIGKAFLKTNAKEVEERIASAAEDDYANICYTSGTTADPKGIILSHKNYVANVYQGYSLMDIPTHFKTLLILPWDHSFAHTAGIYCFMGRGASIAAVQTGSSPMETLKNIPGNIKEIKPDLLLSVPALAKNFKKNIENGIRQKGKVLEKVFRHALKTAYAYNKEGYNKGKGLQILKKPLLWLYDKILFSKIREGFGGDLKFFIGGGALLDIELQRFFYAIGIPVFQGYGLSESAPIISSNSLKKHKLGSSGAIVSNLEIKICDEDGNTLPVSEKGEILVKGDNVMAGYWNNETATKETLKNGWLHTGDMGYMDADGFLYVLGRFKSLLISDDGEKYSPEGIEEAFIQQSEFIEQCMLYNNQMPYTIALIVPNKEALNRWLNSKNLTASNEAGKTAVLKLLESEINEYRVGRKYEKMFPQRWLPSSIAVLNEGFTEENKLMNSTLKIVRGKIIETYSEWIDYLYTAESKDICNEQNMKSLEKLPLK